VTGTGGGTSIRHEDKIYIAPSGVQKELMKPTDMFVMDFNSKEYLRRPQVKPSSSQHRSPIRHSEERQLTYYD
jgi:methylthioribulose-1-phosphate dehydratase